MEGAGILLGLTSSPGTPYLRSCSGVRINCRRDSKFPVRVKCAMLEKTEKKYWCSKITGIYRHGHWYIQAGGKPTPGFWNYWQKRLFFQFRGIKIKFHHFWSPWKKLGKSPPGTPGKNPSDAHVYRSPIPWNPKTHIPLNLHSPTTVHPLQCTVPLPLKSADLYTFANNSFQPNLHYQERSYKCTCKKNFCYNTGNQCKIPRLDFPCCDISTAHTICLCITYWWGWRCNCEQTCLVFVRWKKWFAMWQMLFLHKCHVW